MDESAVTKFELDDVDRQYARLFAVSILVIIAALGALVW